MSNAVPSPHRRRQAWLEIVLALAAAAGAAGCVLPWTQATVRTTQVDHSTPLNALHRIGIVACAGAVVALLGVASRLWLRASFGLADAGLALGGTLMLAGAVLWLTAAGQPLGSGLDGAWTVQLAAGLPLTATAGTVILAGCLLSAVWQRGG